MSNVLNLGCMLNKLGKMETAAQASGEYQVNVTFEPGIVQINHKSVSN